MTGPGETAAETGWHHGAGDLERWFVTVRRSSAISRSSFSIFLSLELSDEFESNAMVVVVVSLPPRQLD